MNLAFGAGRLLLTCAALFGLCCLPSKAFAQSATEEKPSLSSRSRATEAKPPTGTWSLATARTAEAGGFLPLALSPQVGVTSSAASSVAGYDSAARVPVLSAYAEARLFGPLALRFASSVGASAKKLGPGIAARVQFLREETHGVSASASVGYKAEGFTEPEGEIETALAIGRRFGTVLLVGNVLYGQDAEGNERDGELSLSAMLRLTRWAHLGVDTRGRLDLGSRRAALAAAGEPQYALAAGPTASFVLGPVTLVAHAGAAVFRRSDQGTAAGVVALGGAGTAF